MSKDQKNFDELFDKQHEIGKEIQKCFSNYGKLPLADRKNLLTINKQLHKVKVLFDSFCENDKLLQGMENKDSSYFEDTYFENIKTIYERGLEKPLADKSTIEQAIAALTTQPAANDENHDTLNKDHDRNSTGAANKTSVPVSFESNSVTNSDRRENPELVRLIKMQRSSFFMLRKKMEKVHSTKFEEATSESIQLAINGISGQWDIVVENNRKIFSISDHLDDVLPLNYSYKTYSDFEDEIENCISHLLVLKGESGAADRSNPFQHAQSTSLNKMVHLPKIEIPKFDGNPLKWHGFRNLFIQMIDSADILDAQKLFYLKSNLTGAASSLVTIFDTNVDTYKQAWERIESKYNNPRMLTNAIADKLYSQPTMREESAEGLRSLRDVTKECFSSLQNLNIKVDDCESLFIYLLLKKLDNKSREQFEYSLDKPTENPTLKTFYDFLEKRSQALEGLVKQSKSLHGKVVHSTISKSKSEAHNNMRGGSGSCCCCKEGNHLLADCKKFLNFSMRNKWFFVKRSHLCCNCLKKGHFGSDCPDDRCPACSRNHHKLLHHSNKGEKDSGSKDAGKVVLSLYNQLFSNNPELDDNGFVFLGTALVFLTDNRGRKVKCRAILDSCSQVNLLSQKLSKRLGLRRFQHSTNILGVGDMKPLVCREQIVFEFSSVGSAFCKVISALIVPNLTKYQPSEDLDFSGCDMGEIVLADPDFNKPESIDLLLGAGIFPLLLENGIVQLGPCLPQLVKTVLGWIVMGVYSKSKVECDPVCSALVDCDPRCSNTFDENFDFDVNAPRLWEMEESDSRVLSVEEELAVKNFDRTTIRNKDGRFVVKLPKSMDISCLGNSYTISQKRFFSLEKRFAKEPKLFDQYYAFLNEYYQLGHMEKISLNDVSGTAYYIPHHAVMKLDSTTTKLRVVFDASCKSSSGVSLNQVLLKGPVVQSELFDLLIKFRFPRYTMSADIEKMYRQILVDETDQNLQLILWRNNPSVPVSIFRLKTVTYGTTPAPFIATKCLQRLGEENIDKFPLASKILQKDFYVDDLITGVDDLETAIRVQSELISILAGAGFHLRKWCSNDPALLQNVPDVDKEIQWSPKSSFEYVKTLGVIWNPKDDCFSLKVSDPSNVLPITKRVISSESGSIFDPLGFVNPFVVKAKLIIQQLWKEKLDWDAQVPELIADSWILFRKELEKLKTFSIPRRVLCNDPQRIELHGFADASSKAYGAVVYIRSINVHNEVQVTFLCSRSKVAPLSSTTIPKLELSAAKLLAELVVKAKNCIEYTIDESYFWSDSKVVLWWIQKNPGSFKPYVSNRVKSIQLLTKIEQWNHVHGNENPADIISRGMDVGELMKSTLWFEGPAFLLKSQNEWPRCDFTTLVDETDMGKELRKVTVLLHSSVSDHFLESINHRNSFFTLQKVFGFVLRFVEICRKKSVNRDILQKRFEEVKLIQKDCLREYVLKTYVPLTVSELDRSLLFIVKFLQVEHELKKDMNKGLKTLVPFFDNENIIRVGGRLKKSHLPFDAKHQMLLPQCRITDMLINMLHCDNDHASPSTLLSIVRERFWPIQGKRMCSKIFQRCVLCFKAKPKNIQQLMGELPEARTSLVAPFMHTGVDYAGPFHVHYKLRGSRISKAYLAVFVCFSVKAVHLEIVSDLTTEAFLGCLKRFVSRRGRPEQIYSDNATNFVGAKRELQDLADFLKENDRTITDFAAQKGITWSTIPAGSPHFGGLWEAAVKRAKYYLQHSVKGANLTFEELNTVVIEVESILNSRPLCPLSENPNDLGALTPNHFLIPGCSEIIPDKHFVESKKKLWKRWELVTKLRHDIWLDFHKFYLHNLQERRKWTKTTENIEKDRMVLIYNKGALVNKWEMGRVVTAIPGDDGLVRVVDIKTLNGIKRRAITQVAPLPLPSDYEEPILDMKDHLHKKERSRLVDKKKKPSNKNSLNKNLLLTICYMLLMLPFVLGTNVNVTIFQHHPGIFFEGVGEVNIVKDKWHVVTYFNLSEYWTQCNDFPVLLSRTKGLCSDQLCLSTVDKLQSKLNKIQGLNKLIKDECHMRRITKQHDIKKRSYDAPLNVIGNIAHSLFGTLDNKFAEKMELTIGNVKDNENRLMLLIKNHTTIIDQTVNVMKKNNKEISEQINRLKGETMSLTELHIKGAKQILVNSMVNFLSTVMSDYRETQLQIHSMMSDFKRGKLNPLLISPSELETHIEEMRNVLDSTKHKLPSVHYAELETIAQLAVVHGNSCLMFQIEVPLMRNENFDLYRMVPIPTYHKNGFRFIKPTDDFLAIDKVHQFYYLLSSDEYKECTQFYDIRLCSQNQGLYPVNDNNHCEINLFLQSEILTHHCDVRIGVHHEYWIPLRQNNQWLFAVKEEITAKIVCGNDQQTSVETIKLNGEGIVQINPICNLNAPGIRIPGKNVEHSSLFLKTIPSILPKIDVNESTIVRNSTTPLVLKLDNLDAISSAIDTAKKEENVLLKPVLFENGPDVYHSISFGISGFLLIIGILISVYLTCCKKKSQHQQQIVLRAENPRPRGRFALTQEELELS